MTDIAFEIGALRIIDAPPSPSGNRVRATFDLSVSGLAVSNCILIEARDGITLAKAPFGKGPAGKEIRVTIEDEGLAKAVTIRAATAYHALTGRALRVG